MRHHYWLPLPKNFTQAIMETAIRSLLALTVSLSTVSAAHAASKWQGTSTNASGNFNYGKVTFTLDGKVIKDFLIEGVTTSGCSGYKNVIVPRINVRGTKFTVKYIPIPGINDAVVVTGTFKGNKVTGSFAEGPLCSNAGKFTATKK